MKKLVALLLVAVMCFALVACGSKKPVQSEIENFSEKTNVELTVEAVNALLASKEYAQKTAKYEDTFQQKVRTPKVTYVMEYHLDSFDGFALNLLLIKPFGACGAAFASLLTQVFSNFVLGFIWKPLRENNKLILNSLRPKFAFEEAKKLVYVVLKKDK
jgi:uncharacterized protein YacL